MPKDSRTSSALIVHYISGYGLKSTLHQHLALITLISLVLSLPILTSGCGGEETQVNPQRGVSRSRRAVTSNKVKKNKPSQSAMGQGSIQKSNEDFITIPERLKRKEYLHSSGWMSYRQIKDKIKGSRDPFRPDIPELKAQEDIEVDPTSIQRNLVVTVPVLSHQLEFKGSLTGLEMNLAMLEDPTGVGYTVRVGDIVGKSPEFVRVKQITSNEIKFEPILGISPDEAPDSPRLSKKLRESDDYSTLEQRGTP